MNILLQIVLLSSLLMISASHLTAATIEKLSVAPNNRVLQTESGKPFFPIADTAWHIEWKLNRADVLTYLQTRKDQKFNTIGLVAFPDEGPEANVYGDQPFNVVGGKYDPLQPITTPGNDPNNSTEYDYWDHLDFIINSAQDMGLYVIMLPAWGSCIAGDWGDGHPNSDVILDVNNASNYAYWISHRYENYTNIIWMLGGDRSAVYGSYDYRPAFRKMADGVLAGNPNRPLLMSYHPRKWLPNSSEWFHNDSWLSFNSIQDQPSDQINSIRHDYALSPTKPTWLFEGGYEERHGTDYGDWQVRFQAYQTVFAGGFGYTYGHMSIWDFSSDWKTKINSTGANDMRHLYTLMTSMSNTQFFDLIPDQLILDGDTGGMSGSEGIISSCILAMRTTSKDFAMVYSANGRNIRAKMNLLANSPMTAHWFNPRDGSYTLISTNITSGSGAPIHEFDPPGSTANGNDYVLILSSEGGDITPPEPVPPYTDNVYNLGLLHCDAVVTDQWADGSANCLITPDDNSSGRSAVAPILNSSNNWDVGIDNTTLPTFMTNSPYSGDYLSFDGNDTVRITNAWHGGDNFRFDISFRFNELPSASGDNFIGMFWAFPARAYLINSGDDIHGKVLALLYDAASQPHFLTSSKIINPDVWYHVSFSVSNNNMLVVVGNDSEGYQTDTTTATGLIPLGVTDVILGSDPFVPTRLFHGDLDEVRWGTVIPEPNLFIICYFGIWIVYARRYFTVPCLNL